MKRKNVAAPQNPRHNQPTTLRRLGARPVMTEPNLTGYEWAGSTLRRLLKMDGPVAESWPFFSGPSRPARVCGSAGVTMRDLVTRLPELLGPRGADPAHHGQKYFFVKFLDPSDFPPFAYVGFNPTIHTLGRTTKQRKRRFADLLWRDRQAVETFAECVRPQITSKQRFEAFKAAYKRWAIAQAKADWSAPVILDVSRFIEKTSRAQAQTALARQRQIRRQIVSLMHRIEFEPDQAILIETPTLHAIAGLSLQIHPKAPGNFHPKDELWIYKEVPLPRGATGWILVEPQRTFDKTESGADFFTPFAWEARGSGGRLGFRKPITRAYLDQFVELMDATPHPKSHYVRRAQRMTVMGGTVRGAARWYQLVEEPGWPYFTVRELRFAGAGEAVTTLPHHSFVELHATRGAVNGLLRNSRGTSSFTVTPTQPVFLPASLPYDTITYRAAAPAELLYFTRPR